MLCGAHSHGVLDNHGYKQTESDGCKEGELICLSYGVHSCRVETRIKQKKGHLTVILVVQVIRVLKYVVVQKQIYHTIPSASFIILIRLMRV